MNGPHVQGEVEALLDGALDAARRQAVEAHVASCAECAAALAAARRVARAVADVPVPDPGAAYWARFADRVEARLEPRPAAMETPPIYERLLRWLVPPGRWGWVGTASVVATATLVVYVGMRGYKPQPASMPNGITRVQPGAPQPAPPAAAPPSAAGPEPSPVPRAAAPGRAATKESVVRRVAPQVAAPPPPRQASRKGAAPLPAAQEPVQTGAASESPRQGQMDQAPAAPVQETLQAQAAPAEERPPGAVEDPVLAFAHASLVGSHQAARVRYAALVQDDLAAVPDADRPLVRGWDEAGTARADDGPAAAFAPKARVQKDLAPKETAPSRAQLQILDALVWPRREQPGARETVVALTLAWQRVADADAQARGRVRVLAAWLAGTSPTSDEKTRWEAVRDAADDR